jgi:hypothetical protein
VVSPRVTPLGGGLDAPGIGTASKEGGARTGGGMAFCAGSAGDKNVGGVDIAYEVSDRQFECVPCFEEFLNDFWFMCLRHLLPPKYSC